MVIKPQPGYQEKALSSSADIVIGGAGAGVGKTFTLLLEVLRHIHIPDFEPVIFRRTTPQIRNAGGLWSTSQKLYPLVGAQQRESSLEWKFKSGASLKFSHLEYDKDVDNWQGSQIPLIGFDELTHFSAAQFWYMVGRNRSASGIRPYIRATCNPDPGSWVFKLIEWWIKEDGFPDKDRDGVVRWFYKNGEDMIWGDTKAEVIEKAWYLIEDQVKLAEGILTADDFIYSLTFISGSIYENKALLTIDKAYLAKLNAQDAQLRSQLLDGNWKVVVSDNELYDYYSFIGMFDNVYDVEKKGKYITADIATKGSNKFVVWVWEGYELIDGLIMDKSNGPEVIEGIRALANKHKVESRHICYDNDGVGQMVDGFIKGIKPFNNGAAPINKENYQNLKTQCYYKSADHVNAGKYRVSDRVANMMYDTRQTVRQRLIQEQKAIKRAKPDMDGKLQIIPKEHMKTMLGGDSPDLMDAFMQREFFDLQPSNKWVIV